MSKALSCNRLTSRGDAWVPRPLDEVQGGNIAATVQDMSASDRLMFAIGFFRYVLELAHQTLRIIATGDAGDPTQEFNHDEFEGMSLVQTDSKLISNAWQGFREVQMTLETSEGNREYRAWWVRTMLEARYQGILEYDL